MNFMYIQQNISRQASKEPFTEAPVLKRHASSKVCMRCTRSFNMILRKKYNCMGCGDVSAL